MNKKISVTAFSLLLGVVSATNAQVSLTTIGDIDPNGTVPTCLTLSSDLRYRMRDSTGGDVSNLQDFLISSGLMQGESTGYFGAGTLKAVKTFQQKQGLSPTGFVGPLTRAKINTLSCKEQLPQTAESKKKEEITEMRAIKSPLTQPVKQAPLPAKEVKLPGEQFEKMLTDSDRAELKVKEEAIRKIESEMKEYYLATRSATMNEEIKAKMKLFSESIEKARQELENLRKKIAEKAFNSLTEDQKKKLESERGVKVVGSSTIKYAPGIKDTSMPNPPTGIRIPFQPDNGPDIIPEGEDFPRKAR